MHLRQLKSWDVVATWSTATGSPTITSTNIAAWITGAPVSSVFTRTGATNRYIRGLYCGAGNKRRLLLSIAANTYTGGGLQDFSSMGTGPHAPVTVSTTDYVHNASSTSAQTY